MHIKSFIMGDNSTIQLLKKKNELTLEYYKQLLDLKQKRKTLNAEIKVAEKKLGQLIERDIENETSLFKDIE